MRHLHKRIPIYGWVSNGIFTRPIFTWRFIGQALFVRSVGVFRGPAGFMVGAPVTDHLQDPNRWTVLAEIIPEPVYFLSSFPTIDIFEGPIPKAGNWRRINIWITQEEVLP